MNELIEAIKAWPVIVQGALGSALFWLVLVVAQRARTRISKSYSHHSKSARITWLINQQTKYETYSSQGGIPTIEGLNLIFYRAARPFLKSLMWLVYGLIMDALESPAGVIAYLICLSYLFKAFEIVGPIDEQVDPQAKLKEIQDELAALERV